MALLLRLFSWSRWIILFWHRQMAFRLNKNLHGGSHKNLPLLYAVLGGQDERNDRAAGHVRHEMWEVVAAIVALVQLRRLLRSQANRALL